MLEPNVERTIARALIKLYFKKHGINTLSPDKLKEEIEQVAKEINLRADAIKEFLDTIFTELLEEVFNF